MRAHLADRLVDRVAVGQELAEPVVLGQRQQHVVGRDVLVAEPAPFPARRGAASPPGSRTSAAPRPRRRVSAAAPPPRWPAPRSSPCRRRLAAGSGPPALPADRAGRRAGGAERSPGCDGCAPAPAPLATASCAFVVNRSACISRVSFLPSSSSTLRLKFLHPRFQRQHRLDPGQVEALRRSFPGSGAAARRRAASRGGCSSASASGRSARAARTCRSVCGCISASSAATEIMKTPCSSSKVAFTLAAGRSPSGTRLAQQLGARVGRRWSASANFSTASLCSSLSSVGISISSR